MNPNPQTPTTQIVPQKQTTTELVKPDPILLALEEEFTRIDKESENWLPNWYLGKLNTIEALEATIKHQYAVMLRELAARRRTLEYHWFDEFKEAVELDLLKPENSKKKSINYLQGRSGTRKGKAHLIIEDEQKAIDWALENDCEDAVDTKLARKTSMLNKYIADKVVPAGCKVVQATESFFPAAEKRALESDPKPKQIEQE